MAFFFGIDGLEEVCLAMLRDLCVEEIRKMITYLPHSGKEGFLETKKPAFLEDFIGAITHVYNIAQDSADTTITTPSHDKSAT